MQKRLSEKTISLRIPEALHAQLVNYAQRKRITVSDAARNAILSEIRNQREVERWKAIDLRLRNIEHYIYRSEQR